jgi:hypothetical protein
LSNRGAASHRASAALDYRLHAGIELLPVLVTWRRPVPIRLITQICSPPRCVDAKAMCRPLGAKAGLSLKP